MKSTSFYTVRGHQAGFLTRIKLRPRAEAQLLRLSECAEERLVWYDRVGTIWDSGDRALILSLLRGDAGGAVYVEAPERAVDPYAVITALSGLLGGALDAEGKPGYDCLELTISHSERNVPTDAFAFHWNPYVEFPLHTDGSFLPVQPEWIALAKAVDEYAECGETILVKPARLQARIGRQGRELSECFPWFTPRSYESAQYRPICQETETGQRLCFGLVDTRNPLLTDEQIALYSMVSEALRDDQSTLEIELGVGGCLLVDNCRVLHGRQAFSPDSRLLRILLRSQGTFGVE